MPNELSRVLPRLAPLLICLCLPAFGQDAGAAPTPSGEAPSGDRVDFDRDVQPIFSRHCIRCHGVAEKNGGLGLSDRESALAELDSGERGIVPEQPDASEVLRRAASDDEFERMPPTGDPLDAEEIETLRRWIAQGADWPPHWAYRPLVRPDPPAADSRSGADWARNPIDQLVLQTLEEWGLRPSPPADRRTWLRRVTFNLTGLPPTPEELAAFLADDGPHAFERVADRLLSSPRYGERWARHWMDVVHYAETHGHDQDRPRPNAWPYRDYLIRSLNEDKPYARFIQEQIAGDVLFPEDPEAIVATGFLATGPWDESSLRDIREDTLDREIARYLDRDDIVTTVLSTFASTTIHCARCHDHKFDPVSLEDYYALQAVFAATDKAERAFDRDPEVARLRRALTEEKESLPRRRESLDPSLLGRELHAEIAAWEQELGARAAAWTVLEPNDLTSENGATLTRLDDHSILSGGERPETDVYTITARTSLPGITGIRLEVLTDDSLPKKGPGRQDNGNLHLNQFLVTAGPGDASAEPRAIALQNPRADFDQEGWDIAKALDGNAGTAWGIFPEVGQSHRAVFELAEPLDASWFARSASEADTQIESAPTESGSGPDEGCRQDDRAASSGGATLTFRLEQTHGGGHLIGRLRLAVTDSPLPLPLEADVLPAEIAAILRTAPGDRTDRQRADLAAYYREQELDRQLAALPPREKVYAGTNRFEPDGSFRPADRPRTIHVLHRGDVTQPGAEAVPGALSCVPGLEHRFDLPDPEDEGSRRAALAGWLSDARNVLVWRSIANRVWHYHFGRGLVDTPNDFGLMGSTPTHPELLDWLAAELLENGGSLKSLHRLIVTSSVYRQSSSPDLGAESASAGRVNPESVDADNRLLWRMNRTRLDAESIRDAVLQVTGLLDPAMGGPSVKQFIQRPGVHVTPVVDYQGFDPDDPANFRRSVYRFIFRTLPDPFMESLDCPDASQLTPRRTASVSALQALSMLNNQFIVRQSEHLAARAGREAPELPGQIDRIFELCLLRPPSAAEREALADYAARHGLPNACRVLLNTNEFMFVD